MIREGERENGGGPCVQRLDRVPPPFGEISCVNSSNRRDISSRLWLWPFNSSEDESIRGGIPFVRGTGVSVLAVTSKMLMIIGDKGAKLLSYFPFAFLAKELALFRSVSLLSGNIFREIFFFFF